MHGVSIPWLPQTFLVPVARTRTDPDDPGGSATWAERPAQTFLAQNPNVQLHHMHDPTQDRLMIQQLVYFRAKWLILPQAYRCFLRQCLERDGTILSLECELTWPVTRRDERHLFQIGGYGGSTVQEYLHGGARTADFLARSGSQ